MKITLSSLLFIISLPVFSYCTGDSLSYLTAKDTIFLHVDDFGNKIFEHQMVEGQTLYSLARFYGLKINGLLSYNTHLDPEIGYAPGTIINIPIPDSSILKTRRIDDPNVGYIPVRYVVRRGDTFYHIAKHFFNVHLDTLQKWNNLENTMMFSGMQLHVGYLSLEGISDSLQLSNSSPLAAKMLSLQREFGYYKSYDEPSFQNGAAYWQREKTGKSDFYCLHRYAPVGSVVHIKNPMRNKHIYAKVIALIPDRAYGDDIIIVLSPSVAKFLGARDPKFYVELEYFD